MAFLILTIYTIILGSISVHVNSDGNASFDTHYSPLWGFDHLTLDPRGTEVQLLIDESSGAGFESKLEFGSGLFHIRMKIPENKTGGIISTFYLTSDRNNRPWEDHYELDFEFIGTEGRLKTNVFNNDTGKRLQVFQLGFDPSADYHTYEILWNSFQIVFFIDRIPVRVFKNNTSQGLATFPSKAMHIEGSLWNGSWAGDVDWTLSPFIAHYQDFDFDACTVENDDVSACSSDHYYWNAADCWELNATQKQQMDEFRKSYLVYDYCTDPNHRKPECDFN